MPTEAELLALVVAPRESLNVEHKDWLDPTNHHGRATLARAAIALANSGGGSIVLGFAEEGANLVSRPRPDELRAFTQDLANGAVARFADPEFHVEVHHVTHPDTGVDHLVITVPGGMTVPVMSKRDCEGVIVQNRCYIRKPGPRTEEPRSAEEWRALLNRCVQAQREDMLDAIRAIVTGRVENAGAAPNAQETLATFADAARQRWVDLTRTLPAPGMPASFPHGSYEMAFGLVGATACTDLNELKQKIEQAGRTKLTGWPTFLQMVTRGIDPYPFEEFVEAWVGRPIRDDAMTRESALCDFWRVSRDGFLYTIRGYQEDGLENLPAGELFDLTLPVLRIGEGLLFAGRLAETFENVFKITMRCRFTGLQGRRLVSVSGRRYMNDDRVSEASEITLQGTATLEQIADNLPEVLKALLTPLYERFDFFQLPTSLVGQEIQRLRSTRF